ncbi:relaxase/mobilization nuclease domain-containing protein [Yersinia pseudotuberculosis]|uniref:relaxase/mobilization nuclease domain-containing protein n=1 Tax=Yersinia pseudotuberculosis TaxID=633 RepID=UPI003D7CFAF6
MKGMQKIRRGKSFVGVVLYALKQASHHETDPTVIGGNMLSDLANDLIAEFDASEQLRPDVPKPVWHNSLRLPTSESLTTEQWSCIADDYMKRMGFSDTHLRCYVLHDDAAGQHIHIIASRIDVANGKLYLGRNENLISTRIISELEIAHNLTVTKSAASIESKQPKPNKISRNEKMLSERTGVPTPKEALQQILDKSLVDRPELLTFINRLKEAEVCWTANIASTGKMNGFSFEYEGIAFKASQLGKKYAWSNLQKYMNYEPNHDNPLLLNAKSGAPAPAPAKKENYTTKESLTISEKIASLSSSIAFPPPVTVSRAPTLSFTPNIVAIEDRRKRIIDAVLDLQNAKSRKAVKFTRFNSWKTHINTLKILGFYLINSFRKFKRVLTIHALTPSIQPLLSKNIKNHL